MSSRRILASMKLGDGFLLDTHLNSFAAYSLRKLKSGITHGVRVERDSDLAQTDIELYSDGSSIDLSSIVSAGGTFGTWIGSNTATIEVWYDQSGEGNDVANPSPSTSPQLVVTGTLQTKGSLSSLFYSATNNFLSRATLSEMTSGNDISIFSVSALLNSNDLAAITSSTATSTNRFVTLNDNRTQKRMTQIVTGGGTFYCNLTSQNSSTDQRILTSIIDGSAPDLSGWQDGTAQEQNVSWSGSYTNNSFFIGRSDNIVFSLVGYVQEVICFSEKKNTERAAIENEINAHYTIF